jgi:dephospho-CoA kinase
VKSLGITGGIGMGKSACAALLRARGIPVVDTDDLARHVVEPGQSALVEVAQVFGPEVLDSAGALRRDVLARKVFSNAESRRKLESILHPRIRQLWNAQLEEWRAQNHAVAAVIIPLLFETGAERDLDAVLCVACSAATQRERLLARNWSEAEIRERLQAQLPVEQKISRSDYVIWTEGPMSVHEAQLEKILVRLGVSP